MSFCEKLKAALMDETKASNVEYPELADALYKESNTVDEQTAKDHNTIRAIISQEENHHAVLLDIQKRRCVV